MYGLKHEVGSMRLRDLLGAGKAIKLKASTNKA